MAISLKDLESELKKVFEGKYGLSMDSVYEKTDDDNELKYIIFLTKIFYKNTSVLYTKFIFRTNKEKTELSQEYFTYLHDINCIYKQIEFSDLTDLSTKMNKIFNKMLFGDDITSLSKFLESPSAKINELLAKDNISNISVYGFKYDPQVKIVPCEILNFNFVINLNDTQEINLNIVKDKDKEYVYNFRILDEMFSVRRSNLKDIDSVIAHVLKDKVSQK